MNLKRSKQYLGTIMGNCGVNLHLQTLTKWELITNCEKTFLTLQKQKIEKAISRLKTNKSPGNDGLPSEWYKTFSEHLIPLLKTYFIYTLDYSEIQPSRKEAVISVFPKGELLRLQTCISTVDNKLYTLIIAKRYRYEWYHRWRSDKLYYKRQTQDNKRRTLHIIERVKHNNNSAASISLDAEKAFDSVNWAFLYQVLEPKWQGHSMY